MEQFAVDTGSTLYPRQSAKLNVEIISLAMALLNTELRSTASKRWGLLAGNIRVFITHCQPTLGSMCASVISLELELTANLSWDNYNIDDNHFTGLHEDANGFNL